MKTQSFYKGQSVYLRARLGIVLRRQGASHLRVRTERARSFQDFLTLKITEHVCTCEETWPLADVSTQPSMRDRLFASAAAGASFDALYDDPELAETVYDAHVRKGYVEAIMEAQKS